MLLTFYPELKGKNLSLKLAGNYGPIDRTLDFAQGFRLLVYKQGMPAVIGPPPLSVHSIPDETFLTTWFSFDLEGQIREMQASGPVITHDKDRESLKELVDGHRDWSEERLEQAMTEAGVRYGPKDTKAFMEYLPLSRFRQFLGDLRLQTVVFQKGWDEASDREYASAALFWAVDVEATLPQGGHQYYRLLFEPFDGRLISILAPAE